MVARKYRKQYSGLDGFQKNLVLVGFCILFITGLAAANNLTTPEEDLEIGYTEIQTECAGLEVGVCLGVQRETHTTHNYDNYTEAEEGTPEYYRRVESELMLQAYNICDQNMSGMDWTSEASYDGQSGDEWQENENVTLLPCEDTFYRGMDAEQ